ncbi:MAG: hypothetical protein Q7U16_02410 [Agitococcus sp.]|nr:hypothetical protein [Agitococcus sp.]
MATDAMFIIESGKALAMVRKHIAERISAQSVVRELAKDLRITEVLTDRTTGILTGVVFPAEIHAEFTKPKKRTGTSYPKKNTAWAARFAEQKGYRDPATWIAHEFSIPLSLSYRRLDSEFGNTGSGWSRLGSMLTACGFLYLSEHGPYAMWTPDVPALVAERLTPGILVEEPAASFKFDFDGCRRITHEEWDILVLQHASQLRTSRLIAALPNDPL